MHGHQRGPVTALGNNLTVPVAMTFQTGDFAGLKNIYGYANTNSGQNGGWSQLGTWTSGASAAPVVVSVTPINNGGSPQTFTAVYSDAAGTNDLSAVYLLFSSPFSASIGCLLLYVPSTDTMYLYNDSGTGVVAGSVHPGTPGTLSNSQCTIGNAGGASAVAGKLTLSVSVTLLPVPVFIGTQYVYAYAASSTGPGSGWQRMGTWDPVRPVRVVSVTPINGTGSQTVFNASYSDTAGAGDLFRVYLLFNTTLSSSNGCLVVYNLAEVYGLSNNSMYLYNDAGTGVVPGSINPGAAGTLSNSQCTIGGPISSPVTLSGNNLSLSLMVTFAPGFTGSKNVYGFAESSTGIGISGWENVGTWITN